MQITAAASRDPNSSRSSAWIAVPASSQPIRARSLAMIASTYTMSDVGIWSSGQHHGRRISRRRA
jgi:hypothetical protein